MEELPDEAWCQKRQGRLQQDDEVLKALEKIGKPLFLKLKKTEDGPFVITRLAEENGQVALGLHDQETVEEEGLIVSMTLDTWRRLLSGSLDLATGLMGRDVKAKGSMFELMRIADPAERIIQAFARVEKGGA
jgi:putative sterol carrier protein